MVRNYVMQRERYNYDLLKKQFTFIKNNSTRIVFRRFFNFMNIDNPSSPVMQYQKSANRNIKILSADYTDDNNAIVTFHSEARGATGNVLEDTVWQATISYEIDKIDPYLPSGSRFNFTVTDYQLKLIEDKRKK
jgi:type IV secretion system protein VirB8